MGNLATLVLVKKCSWSQLFLTSFFAQNDFFNRYRKSAFCSSNVLTPWKHWIVKLVTTLTKINFSIPRGCHSFGLDLSSASQNISCFTIHSFNKHPFHEHKKAQFTTKRHYEWHLLLLIDYNFSLVATPVWMALPFLLAPPQAGSCHEN